MKYGYARVSTIDQDTALQLSALRKAGCRRIYQEKRSAVKDRPELDALLTIIGAGDELVIYKLDRLARSLKDLLRIVETLTLKGAHLRSLTEPLNHDTAAGKMMLQMLGVFAEFERNIIRERTMAGQLEAVRQGKNIGRPSKLTPQEQSEVIQLYESGIPVGEIGRAYGINGTRVRTLWLEATGQLARPFGVVKQLHMRNINPTLHRGKLQK